MKWILFYLTFSDNVKYITNDMNKLSIMGYKKFMKFVKTFPIKNVEGLFAKVNRFDTLLLNCETGEWEVKKPQLNKEEITQQKLMELNQDKVILKDKLKEETQKTSPLKSLWERGKIDLEKTYKIIKKGYKNGI